MTLRPASATWSSAVTPGRLADDEVRVRRRRPASGDASLDDVRRATGRPRGARDDVAPAAVRRRRSPRLGVGAGRVGRCGDAARRRPAATRGRPAVARGRGHRRLELAAAAPAPAPGPRRTPSASPASRSSSPLTSSASSSTNRSTTRDRATTSTSSRLSSTRVSPSRTIRLRRSWRIVTSSTSGASPASSSTSERASDAGHSSGPARPVGRALELLAPDRPAGALRPRERLDRDDRAAARSGGAGPRTRPARSAPSAVST